MGRKRIITTEELVSQAERYISERCGGNVLRFKIAQFSRYLISNGYPVYDPVIRRNKDFMAYIAEKKNGKKSIAQKNVVYERMDVDGLLNSGRGVESVRRTLINREDYYKTIYESFVEINARNKAIEKKTQDIMRENTDLKHETEDLKNEMRDIKKQLREARDLLKDYKEQITDYLYPGIAAEIIKKIEPSIPDQRTGIVNADIVEKNTVHAYTDLFQNKLVNELFITGERN